MFLIHQAVSLRAQRSRKRKNQSREAIEFHLDGMREDNIFIPPPSSRVEYVEVAA
jgi:hypothetical protein